MAARRRKLVIGSCVALVLVAALVVGYSLVRRAEGGPLNLGTYPSSVGVGVDVGATMTYGDVVSRNEGTRAAVIEQAELLTHDSGATVAEVRVLDTDSVEGGTLIGEAQGYDPPSVAMRVPGAVMEPTLKEHQKAYQFIFSISVSNAGGAEFYGLRVRYRVGGREYVTTAPYQLRLCTPRSATCEPSPPKAE